MCGRVPHIICASSYDSCRDCAGNGCKRSCYAACDSGCFMSDCTYGCINSSCGRNSGSSYCAACGGGGCTFGATCGGHCAGLATIFYFFIIGNTY